MSAAQSAGSASVAGEPSGPPELRRRVLPFVEVFAQSLADTGPSGSLAFGPALVFLSAGRGAWLSYVLSLIGLMLVGWALAAFGTRIASAGSLYAYAAEGFGAAVGFLVGWAMIIGYLVISMVVVAGSGLFFGQFLKLIGLDATGTGAQVVLDVLIGSVAVYFALRDVRLSTRVALLLECVSIAAITTVLVATVVKHGIVDRSQLRLDGVSRHGVVLGMVLAITGYVGFESAASLGLEARNPRRAVPRAIVVNILACGVYFVLGAYIQVLGFNGMGKDIGKSAAPLNDLATGAGVGWLRYVIDLGIGIGFVAVTVAGLVAVSRILYTMGREGLLPAAFGRVSDGHRAPNVALAVVGPVVTVTVVVSLLAGLSPVDILGYYGSIATYAFIVSYLVVSLAAAAYLRRLDQLRPVHVVLSLLGAAAMATVLYYSLYPAPAWPYNILPYVFLGLMVPGAVWYLLLHRRHPDVAARAGSLSQGLHTS